MEKLRRIYVSDSVCPLMLSAYRPESCYTYTYSIIEKNGERGSDP